MQMTIDMGSIDHISIAGMKLGVHLLETCRLRKENARDVERLEAEWWERRVLRGLRLLTAGRVSFDSGRKIGNPVRRQESDETPCSDE
jgi:hypothetical protein